MKIRRVSANFPEFRTVEFADDLNLVIADRTHRSSDTDSRNGLGKSTLVEIINFCLGSNLTKGQSLYRLKDLREPTFRLALEIQGSELEVSRALDRPNEVTITGPIPSGLDVQIDHNRLVHVRMNEWKRFLGAAVFALDEYADVAYSPTFRSLFAYFARSGRGAFVSPFQSVAQQRAWNVQVNNAYLLGLNWRLASRWQTLKDDETVLKTLTDRAPRSVARFRGSLGELETERVRVAAQVADMRSAIAEFRVLPQYRDVQQRLDLLTSQIKEAMSEVTLNQNMIDLYSQRLEEESEVDVAAVIALYDEVGITLPDLIRRSVDEVAVFHREISQNRRAYLEAETSRLHGLVTARRAELDQLEAARQEALRLLASGGALDDLTQLQERFAQLSGQLEALNTRTEELRMFEAGKENLKIERQQLKQQAMIDHYERRPQWSDVIANFARITQELYGEPGDLVIDVTNNGYAFEVRLERGSSHGVGNMGIFAYDLAVSQAWAARQRSPGVLIHDSAIFEGVDERQVAVALNMAATEATNRGFQYIALINSDSLPFGELERRGFKVDDYLSIRLTDDDPAGSLFGHRF